MSSAILYAAIIAIWAGVLIPRWLRRDTSERASDDAATAQDTPVAEVQPDTPPPQVRVRKEEAPRTRGEEAPRTRGAERPGMTERTKTAERPQTAERPGVAQDGREQDGRDGDDGGFSSDQEHGRVLAARRRLLGMLLVLTAGSCALAVTGLAAWWVMAPPTVMLLGYLALLREASKADAERRELALAWAAEIAAEAPAPAVAVPSPAAPGPAPDAEIIDISASAGQGGAEFYDQYADAKRRAVGDLVRSAAG
ncbi:MAG: hypothetical protein M3Z75_02165 [Actinomycetota bacterium]|nr:hypothetical protein [Actinomycetota bacterium]